MKSEEDSTSYSAPSQGEGRPSVGVIVARAFFQCLFAFAIWAGLLFSGAGTLRWPRGWLHIVLWGVTFAVNFIVLMKANPAVVAERTKRQKITKAYDMVLMPFILVATLSLPLVAGLDAVRCEWTLLPLWAFWIGVALHAGGDVLVLWAMAVNPYLEKTVRIQKERGHEVVTTGPYRYVRHPMYAGVIPMFAAMPLVLGSAWAMLPVGVMAVLILIRTVYEERTLRDELPGYVEYTHSTRYRVIPGVW